MVHFFEGGFVMKKVVVSFSALALVFLVSGCADSLDSVVKDSIKVQNEYADILEGIKSKDDVEKAKPKLEALQKKMNDIGERTKKLLKDKKPEEMINQLVEVTKKYEEDGKKAQERVKKARESAIKAAGADGLKDLELKEPVLK